MSVHHFEAKETKGEPKINTKLLWGLTVSKPLSLNCSIE